MAKKDLNNELDGVLNKVKSKKEELEKQASEARRNTGWLTTCSVRVKSGTFNISTATQIDHLVAVLAELIVLEEGHKKACEALDLEIDFKYDNYSITDWTTDIKKRISFIKLKEETERLDKVEKSLKVVMSEEHKRQKAIENAIKELKI